ncbi:hypothetical protein V2J09_015138 [Rumex salicifolius]
MSRYLTYFLMKAQKERTPITNSNVNRVATMAMFRASVLDALGGPGNPILTGHDVSSMEVMPVKFDVSVSSASTFRNMAASVPGDQCPFKKRVPSWREQYWDPSYLYPNPRQVEFALHFDSHSAGLDRLGGEVNVIKTQELGFRMIRDGSLDHARIGSGGPNRVGPAKTLNRADFLHGFPNDHPFGFSVRVEAVDPEISVVVEISEALKVRLLCPKNWNFRFGEISCVPFRDWLGRKVFVGKLKLLHPPNCRSPSSDRRSVALADSVAREELGHRFDPEELPRKSWPEELTERDTEAGTGSVDQTAVLSEVLEWYQTEKVTWDGVEVLRERKPAAKVEFGERRVRFWEGFHGEFDLVKEKMKLVLADDDDDGDARLKKNRKIRIIFIAVRWRLLEM